MEKLYVKVISVIDTTGYMQPKAICWPDGRQFQIQEILTHRLIAPTDTGQERAYYSIRVCGQKRTLYFERARTIYHSHFGRWYVEVENEEESPAARQGKQKNGRYYNGTEKDKI